MWMCNQVKLTRLNMLELRMRDFSSAGLSSVLCNRGDADVSTLCCNQFLWQCAVSFNGIECVKWLLADYEAARQERQKQFSTRLL